MTLIRIMDPSGCLTTTLSMEGHLTTQQALEAAWPLGARKLVTQEVLGGYTHITLGE